MASKEILPKKDLKLLAHAKVGDTVGTRLGDVQVTQLMRTRAIFALKKWK